MDISVTFDEGQRQAVLLALAHTAVERPGWLPFLREIALKMDTPETRKRRQIEALRGSPYGLFTVISGHPLMFERFRQMRLEEIRNAPQPPDGWQDFPSLFDHRVVFLPPLTKMNFPITTEENAREMIQSGQAGYWELSLRDSISKIPIPHPEQTVMFLAGEWYIVPKEAFQIHPHGRVGDEAMNCNVDTIEVKDDALGERIQEEMKRLGAKPAHLP